jgi:hypothetical protein
LATTEQRQEARLTHTGQAQEGWCGLLYEPLDLGIWHCHWLCFEAEAAGRRGYPPVEGLTTVLGEALWRAR